MPSKHDEVGTTRLARNCARVDYWCCPFGAHCVVTARFGRHVATCREQDCALFRDGFVPCRRCATHLVARADAATHAARTALVDAAEHTQQQHDDHSHDSQQQQRWGRVGGLGRWAWYRAHVRRRAR